jgi:hypothetical protein
MLERPARMRGLDQVLAEETRWRYGAGRNGLFIEVFAKLGLRLCSTSSFWLLSVSKRHTCCRTFQICALLRGIGPKLEELCDRF